MVQRHRAEFWRRINRLKTIAIKAKHTLLLAIGAASLLAASAAGAPEPGVSAAGLFNKANADERAGRLGPAILGYERAAFLAPRDKAVAQNLRIAREKAGVPAPPVAAWQRPAHLLSFDALAGLGSISLLLLCLLVFGTRLIPATLRGAARGVAAAFGVTVALSASGLAVRWPELNRAVIQSAHASARIAPASSAESVFELKPGDFVTVRQEHADFALVRTPDARSGWVKKSEFEPILPPSASLSSM